MKFLQPQLLLAVLFFFFFSFLQIGMGWSTHLSRSRQNLVKNRFLEALQCKFEQKSHMVCGSSLKFLNHQLFSSILDSHQICPKILAESRSEMKGHHQEYEKCDSPVR
uniref:Uncharacterized protein n=1 Tax=Populus davidiana TaxID=266767 RepID=A0A6M2FAB0_9ROSI